MKTGLYSRHWILARSDTAGLEWYHRSNPKMRVMIDATHTEPTHKKVGDRLVPVPSRRVYFVFHTHPKKNGSVIMQPIETASTLKEARKLALAHLKNWNDPLRWFKHH